MKNGIKPDGVVIIVEGGVVRRNSAPPPPATRPTKRRTQGVSTCGVVLVGGILDCLVLIIQLIVKVPDDAAVLVMLSECCLHLVAVPHITYIY